MAEQAEASALDGERKTVSALFADIKGSTELEQDLDPEEARAIIDPALKLMIEAVRRYDGYVVQSTGDGIFAFFGAPVAHEDHPQRALYAALRMQEELHRYSARLREAGNLPLEARVGVNTGEVVVRSQKTKSVPVGRLWFRRARATTLSWWSLRSLGVSRRFDRRSGPGESLRSQTPWRKGRSAANHSLFGLSLLISKNYAAV